MNQRKYFDQYDSFRATRAFGEFATGRTRSQDRHQLPVARAQGSQLLGESRKKRALKALHASKWRQAADTFQRVMSESDQPDLINRARRYMTIAEEQIDGNEEIEADKPLPPPT